MTTRILIETLEQYRSNIPSAAPYSPDTQGNNDGKIYDKEGVCILDAFGHENNAAFFAFCANNFHWLLCYATLLENVIEEMSS